MDPILHDKNYSKVLRSFIKIMVSRETSANLRYKTGRSLTSEDKDVLAVKDPKKIYLASRFSLLTPIITTIMLVIIGTSINMVGFLWKK